MELYTLDRNFQKKDVIDKFSSVIWTERYYGDSEVELVVTPTLEMIQKLPLGTFLRVNDSNEVMILETATIENGLKLKGISLLSWLNNRFIRVSAAHEDKFWYLSGNTPGATLWLIVYNMCVSGSPYLNGGINTGVVNPERLVIPGLGLNNYDASGEVINVGVPYGPVYAALREIAITYEVGMQILLDNVTDTSYSLGFRSYRGLDRSSNQTDNPIVRFSPQMDSLTDIKEIQSIAALKTLTYVFAPSNPGGLATTPGIGNLTGSQYVGFDLRALMVFADDITTDMVGASAPNLLNVLNARALDELNKNRFIAAIDGEIVPENQFKYGVHYNLGDVVEVQGNSEIVQTARIIEYIRSQDVTGEKAYPALTMIG